MKKLWGNKPQKTGIIDEVLDKYTQLKDLSSERLSKYEENKKWFQSDVKTMYPGGRKPWQTSMLVNLIESNLRTLVAVLTDSKPIYRVVAMPYKTLDDQQEEQMSVLSQNLDAGLGHVWRVNDQHSKLKKIVLDGTLTGLLVSRVYWDKSKYNGIGEIGIETIHPKYVFFDKNVQELNIEDGSCDWFIYAVDKPLSWFHYYFPGKDVKPTETSKDNRPSARMGRYIEAYKAEYAVENDKPKFPRGRRIIIGTDTKLDDGPIDIFPFAVEPIADQTETLMGCDDVSRQIELQRDLQNKMNQLSQYIQLMAARQAVADDECGIDLDTYAENADRAGMLWFLEGGKKLEDFHKHFEVLKNSDFKPELFNYIYIIQEFMEKITGVTKLIQGVAGKRERQTGFEIGKMLETATIRLRERAGHIESFLRQLGLICLQYMKINYTEERDLWYVNEKDEIKSVNNFRYPVESRITGEEAPVDYEFDIVIQPDSTLPMDLNSMADLAMRLKERGVITNQELLKRVHYPDISAALPDQIPGPQGQAAPPPPPTGATQ